MARVRAGQAPAWPLSSHRSVRRGSRVKRGNEALYRRYTAFLCCDLAALSPAAAARLYISSVLPLKISNRRRQSEPAALLELANESRTVVFRCDQSSRLLTIAAAVASRKPRTSGLTPVPSSAQIAPACVLWHWI
jgi:hypothetical protein